MAGGAQAKLSTWFSKPNQSLISKVTKKRLGFNLKIFVFALLKTVHCRSERNPGRIGRLFNCNDRCFFIWREAPKPKCLPGLVSPIKVWLNKVTIYLSINLSIYSYYKHLMVISPHSIINQPILAMTKPGSAPYNALYGEASPERGIYFRPQVYERAGNNSWSIWKVKKSVISVCTKVQKGLQMYF